MIPPSLQSLNNAIEDDFKGRLLGYHKSRREGLCLLSVLMLNAALRFIPEGANVMLAADRFYGTAALIGWCQKAGWGYRIHLKGNLSLQHEGGEISTGATVKSCSEGVTLPPKMGPCFKLGVGLLLKQERKDSNEPRQEIQNRRNHQDFTRGRDIYGEGAAC